jgi:catechol 2,3-dioxygenase-like lactoylglutathione lyase family enzyme
MIAHVSIGVRNIDKSKRFYDAPLRKQQEMERDEPWRARYAERNAAA